MYKNLITIIIVIFLISCGTQRQLQKTYVGKPVSALSDQFGKPVTVIENADEKIYVFEKEEELESTEISQGKLTLDPIITPKVLKTERYFFTVKDGKIIKTRMEEEYER